MIEYINTENRKKKKREELLQTCNKNLRIIKAMVKDINVENIYFNEIIDLEKFISFEDLKRGLSFSENLLNEVSKDYLKIKDKESLKNLLYGSRIKTNDWDYIRSKLEDSIEFNKLGAKSSKEVKKVDFLIRFSNDIKMLVKNENNIKSNNLYNDFDKSEDNQVKETENSFVEEEKENLENVNDLVIDNKFSEDEQEMFNKIFDFHKEGFETLFI